MWRPLGMCGAIAEMRVVTMLALWAVEGADGGGGVFRRGAYQRVQAQVCDRGVPGMLVCRAGAGARGGSVSGTAERNERGEGATSAPVARTCHVARICMPSLATHTSSCLSVVHGRALVSLCILLVSAQDALAGHHHTVQTNSRLQGRHGVVPALPVIIQPLAHIVHGACGDLCAWQRH